MAWRDQDSISRMEKLKIIYISIHNLYLKITNGEIEGKVKLIVVWIHKLESPAEKSHFL
jgi:hypothetical protein